MSNWASAQLLVLVTWVQDCLKDTDIVVSNNPDDLEDFNDGIIFIRLIEHLSKKPFGKYNKAPRFPGQKLDNLSVAFRWLESNWKVKVPCNPSAILEGQMQAVMGLLFLMKNYAEKHLKTEAKEEEKDSVDSEDDVLEQSQKRLQELKLQEQEVQKLTIEAEAEETRTRQAQEEAKRMEEETRLAAEQARLELEKEAAQLAAAEEEARLAEIELQKKKETSDALPAKSPGQLVQSASSPDLGQDAFLKRELSRKRLTMSKEAKEMADAKALIAKLKTEDLQAQLDRATRAKERADSERKRLVEKEKQLENQIGQELDSLLEPSSLEPATPMSKSNDSIAIDLPSPKRPSKQAPNREKYNTVDGSSSRRHREVSNKDAAASKDASATGKDGVAGDTTTSALGSKTRTKRTSRESSRKRDSTSSSSTSTTTAGSTGTSGKKHKSRSRSTSENNPDGEGDYLGKNVLHHKRGSRLSYHEDEEAEREREELFKKMREKYKDSIASFEKPANHKSLVRIQSLLRGKMHRKFDLSKDVKNWKRRKYIATEILTTEEFYVTCLTFMVKHDNGYWKNFQAPFWGLAKHPQYSTIASLFQTAQVMLSFNELLLKGIRERMQRFHQEQSRMGDVFQKFIGFLKVYIDYVNKYETASIIIKQLSVENPAFGEKLVAIKNDAHNPKMQDINSLLIMPIQRLPRYVMLLQELKSHTPPNHPHYEELCNAFKSMSDVAQDVNLKKKNIENRAAVVLVSNLMIASEFCFYNLKEDSTRSYERQGFLIRFEVDLSLPQSQTNANIDNWLKSQAKPMTKYVFLFNDILVITEMERSNTGRFGALMGKAEAQADLTMDDLRDSGEEIKFRFLKKIDLFGSVITEYEESKYPNLFALSFKSEKDKESFEKNAVHFRAETTKLYTDWLFDIDRLSASLLAKRRSRIAKEDLVPDEAKAAPIVLELIHISSVTDPNWVKRYAVLRGTKLLIYLDGNTFLNTNDPPLDEFDVLDADVNLCHDSEFVNADDEKLFYFSLKKPAPNPLQYFFYVKSNVKRRLWLTSIRSNCLKRILDIESRSK